MAEIGPKDDTEPEPLDPFRSTIYEQMKSRAARILRGRRDHRDPETLSLVNDVLLNMLRTQEAGALPDFETDDDLLRYLSRSMRNHLVNRALHRQAKRRPPEEQREVWTESISFPATSHPPADLLDINEALEALAKREARLAQIVELMFFGGCSQSDVARILGDDRRAVRRDWEFARAWLRERLASGRREGDR